MDQLKLTVKPIINLVLSEYITNLTGITNEEVSRDGIRSFPHVASSTNQEL